MMNVLIVLLLQQISGIHGAFNYLPQFNYNLYATHPVVELMMRNSGADEERIRRFKAENDKLALIHLNGLPSTRFSDNEVVTPYLGQLGHLLTGVFGSKYFECFGEWIQTLEGVMIFRQNVKALKMEIANVVYFSFPASVYEQCNGNRQVIESFHILEFDISQLLSAIRVSLQNRTRQFPFLHSYHNLITNYTIKAIHALFARLKQPLAPLVEAMKISHSAFKEAIIEYACRLMPVLDFPADTIPVFSTVKVTEGSAPSPHRYISHWLYSPPDLMAIVDGARKTLSKPSFDSFVNKQMKKLLTQSVAKVDRSSNGDAEIKRLQSMRAKIEKSIISMHLHEKEMLSLWSAQFDQWFSLHAQVRLSGASGYWQCFGEMMVTLEDVQRSSPESVAPMIEWAEECEKFWDNLQRLLVEHQIVTEQWKSFYNTFKSLQSPLSVILKQCQYYKPLPDTMSMSIHSQKTLLASKDAVFGLSPVIQKFLHSELSKRSKDHEYSHQSLIMTLEGTLLCLQSESHLFNTSRTLSELGVFAQRFDNALNTLTENTDISRTDMQSLYSYFKCIKTAMVLAPTLGIIVHFHSIDTRKDYTVLNHFERHLALAKLLHMKSKCANNEPFNTFVGAFYESVCVEMRLLNRMGAFDPRIYFGIILYFLYSFY